MLKPYSSVRSSPTNTGVRPRNGASSMNSAIAVPLSLPAGRSSTTILPALDRERTAWAGDEALRKRRDRRRRPAARGGSAAPGSVPCPRSARRGARRRRRRVPRALPRARGAVARMPVHRARRVAALDAVLTGDRERERREQRSTSAIAPAADQRERAAESRRGAQQQLDRRALDGDRVRACRRCRSSVPSTSRKSATSAGRGERARELGRAAVAATGRGIERATVPRAAAARRSRRRAR